MGKSVLQSERECFICGTTVNLEEHHCLHGAGNRKLAEKYGLKVMLCAQCHRGGSGVHFNRGLDLKLKKYAQTYWESNIGTREGFMRTFGKSYL